jgi:NTE family protein
LRKFVQVQVSAKDQAANVFDRRGHKLAELELTRYGGEAAAGRELGTWGELRAGVLREAGEMRVQVGDPGVPDRSFETGEAFAQFFLDKLDEVAFPHSGSSLRVRASAGLGALGSDTDYQQGLVEAACAATRGRYTGLLSGMFATTRDSDAPIQSLFPLGGFGRLSGLEQNELSGQHAALLSATCYRRMVDFNLLPVYAGLSLEYGNVFQTRADIGIDQGITAGGVFLGVETLIGPLHLAYARADGGRSNYYLTLGQSLSGQRRGFGGR